MTTVAVVLRDVIASALIVAGGAKASDVHGFGLTLAGIGLARVPAGVRRCLAVGIISVEVLVGFLLIVQTTAAFVAAVALGLTAVFAIVSFTALKRGVQVHCRCFGALSGTSFSPAGAFRSLLLLGVAGAAVLATERTDLKPLASWWELAGVGIPYLVIAAAAAQSATVLDALHSVLER